MKKILIIDDDPSLALTMQEMLQLLDHHAEVANSLTEARGRLVKEENWDVIISDYTLGDGTGVDVFNVARENGLLETTKFIIASGYESAQELGVEESVAQAVSWLQKPFSLTALMELLG